MLTHFDQIKQTLGEIGLGENEIKVYLALFEIGQAHVLEISRKSKIPRATVYNIIEKLAGSGLVNHLYRGRRCYYYVENPNILSLQLTDKKQKIDQLMPELQLLYGKVSRRPVIRSFEGIDGLERMLEDILTTVKRGSSYDVILKVKDEFLLLGQTFNRFVRKRIDRNISVRAIVEESSLTRDWCKTEKEDLRLIKYLPKDQHFSVSYHIYGDKVAIFSLRGPAVGVIIEDKEIANMERLQFEYMWRALRVKRN